MEDLASNRYKIINTMVKTFIEQERKFFGTCFSLINNFYNNMDALQQPVPYKKSSYDPMKYTRATKIMEGVDTNSLPEIKVKDKYSLNNKNNNIQRANSSLNNFPSSNIGNNNEIINKKFSFEDYKIRKASLDNANKKNNNNISNNFANNINTISNNFGNNNINGDNQKLNPYSYEAYKKRTQSLGNYRNPQINNSTKSNNNYYNSNLNLVMNSIIGENKYQVNNPFNDINSNNIYSSNINNSSNKYDEGTKNNNNANDVKNPYSNIFNSSANVKNNLNNANNMYNNIFENKGNQNDNNKSKKDPYNFGF
jgi:hypothetical protein